MRGDSRAASSLSRLMSNKRDCVCVFGCVCVCVRVRVRERERVPDKGLELSQHTLLTYAARALGLFCGVLF